MWSFGWNDVALYSISIIAIILILVLQRFAFRHKQAIIYTIFIGMAIVAALISNIIKHDILGTIITRAIIFEAITIYFLGTSTKGGEANGRIRGRDTDPQ